MSKLKTAYDAATAKLGADLPLALARAFGAVDSIDQVPAERRDGLTAALNKVVNGGLTVAMAKAAAHGDAKPKRRDAVSEGESIFKSIRTEAYGADEDEAPEAPKSFADIHAQAYARWNRKRQKAD